MLRNRRTLAAALVVPLWRSGLNAVKPQSAGLYLLLKRQVVILSPGKTFVSDIFTARECMVLSIICPSYLPFVICSALACCFGCCYQQRILILLFTLKLLVRYKTARCLRYPSGVWLCVDEPRFRSRFDVVNLFPSIHFH